MTEAYRKKILVRSAMLWACAIATPTIVMVVLDLFDKHTPNNITLFSLFALFGVFFIHQAAISKLLLAADTEKESDRNENA